MKAVLFDLDGTLLDTLTDLMNALNTALIANDRAIRTRAEVRRFLGNGIAVLVERALAQGKEDPLYEQILAKTKAEYQIHCNDETSPYAGIPEMVREFAEKGWRIAVVSNKPDHHVKALCARFFPEVTAAVGQQEGMPLKPAPDTAFHALSLLGCTKEEAVYVGDSDVDFATAQNAGLPCVCVLWGFRDKELLQEIGGTHFAQSPKEVLPLCEKLTGQA